MELSKLTSIFFDVDGIFTDGSLYLSDNGLSMTKFNVHDGMGCLLLKHIGIELIIISARNSEAITKRFKDLGINKVFTGVIKKRDFIKRYKIKNNLNKVEVAMVGDDLQDLSAIDEVGIFFTTPNAIENVKACATYITKKSGGYGAVREICDLIITSKGSGSAFEFEQFIKKSD